MMGVRYEVTVVTGTGFGAGTGDTVSVTLVGREGQSRRHNLPWDRDTLAFTPGSSHTCELVCKRALGPLLLVIVSKTRGSSIVSEDSEWLCHSVSVRGPDHTRSTFPCHSWLANGKPLYLMEGKARLRSQCVERELQERWDREIEARREGYRWGSYVEGVPGCVEAKRSSDLPRDARHLSGGQTGPFLNLHRVVKELGLEESLITDNRGWGDMSDVARVCSFKATQVTMYVVKHWKEESFFGYQFLNGSNPVLIKQCLQLPPSLPLTDSMVSPSLGSHTSLQQQLQAGNVYIVDYEILKGIPAHSIAGHPQYLSAPICLLHLTPSGQLIPIAIQLNQEPGDHNPIFLPSDPKYVWRLAKIWVRHADVQVHQLVSHLLRTHLISEVFCVATMRTLPDAHPLFKLLMPHVKYTLQVNTDGRQVLLSDGGAVDKAFSTGGQAKAQLLQRATERITFPSLCLPEELATRGVEKLPNYYYRDDGLRVWAAINSFVEEIVQMYYEDDVSVGDDTDVQAFAREIFTEGFLSRSSSGFPTSLTTRPDLIKFLTMIIFTCSAQHSALNGGQFDWGGWMPNNPSSLRRPPPTHKGEVTEEAILETFPTVATTVSMILIVHSLTRQTPNLASLGVYSEVRFTEPGPQQSIEKFLDRLKLIKAAIDQRNQGLDLPYTYLRPDLIENSVSI